MTLSAPVTSLFSVAPGNTVSLVATPRDKNGAVLTGLGTVTFTSSDPAVATVSGAGLVTAVAAGGVQITASLTAQGVTRTGTVSLTVMVAPQSASVTNQLTRFAPDLVDIRAGGTVTWTFGPVAHDVTFTQAGAPANIAAFADGSQSRSFPVGGSFDYQCTIHAGMTGIVRVH
ncbi:MAG TPA: Ig-like domain-containing protein [Gemmatimonadales bacterium]|nr:Ig-like domain-containing protein [Gemmatimonadales bacterium]